MPFALRWTVEAQAAYERLRQAATPTAPSRDKRKKSSKAQGLFKQVHKSLNLLANVPRHPGLNSHEFHSLPHPWDSTEKVWESYAQNRTPGAYRIFWCYGPKKGEITIIAITPHP